MKILVVQNRMGIGDTVIFLPFIEAISKKFNVPVSLLVKKSSKADQYLKQTDYLDNIIFLERNNKKDDKHNFDNYRPISLLPGMSEVFERFLHNQLCEYFNEQKLLYVSQ